MFIDIPNVRTPITEDLHSGGMKHRWGMDPPYRVHKKESVYYPLKSIILVLEKYKSAQSLG